MFVNVMFITDKELKKNKFKMNFARLIDLNHEKMRFGREIQISSKSKFRDNSTQYSFL